MADDADAFGINFGVVHPGTVSLKWDIRVTGTGDCLTQRLASLEGIGKLVESSGDVPARHGTLTFEDLFPEEFPNDVASSYTLTWY